MKYAMMEKKMYKPVMGSLPFCDMLKKVVLNIFIVRNFDY